MKPTLNQEDVKFGINEKDNSKTIIYILFDGFDTNNGTNHLALTMMEKLMHYGKNVYLVTSHSKGLHPDIPDSLKNNPRFSYSVINRAVVGKQNFIHRYLDGVRYAFKSAKAWRKNIDCVDAIILQSTQTAFWSSMLLHKYAKRKPVIFNSFDVFPDGIYKNGAIKSKLIFKLFHAMQNRLYKNSAYVIAISSDMKNTLKDIGIPEEKIEVVHNWYDDSKIRIINYSDNQFIKKYNIDASKFIVQYAGNFGYNFDYKAVLNVANQLKDKTNIEFHMIGEGGFEENFVTEAQNLGLTNIKFFPWQDQSIISDVYNACDIEFIPLTKQVIFYSYPSKGSLLMACKKAVLYSIESNSDFFRTVNKQKIGFCVDRDSETDAADMLYKLSQDKTLIQQIEENGFEFAHKYLSSSSNMEILNNLIDKLIQ